MTPEDIESQRQYLERGAAQARDSVLRQARGMVAILEKADSVATAKPEQAYFQHECMQRSILWTAWNCGLAELLHAGHKLEAFDQQYPRP